MGILNLPASRGSPLPRDRQTSLQREQTEDARATCVVPALFRLVGSLNKSALEQSLGDIVLRHEVLRTRAFESVPISLFDLRSHPENQREFLARQIASEEAIRPFDLASGPLLRASLFQLRDHEHLLLLSAHDIAFDDISAELAIRELAILYNARITGRPPSLPDLPVQYSGLLRHASDARSRTTPRLLEKTLSGLSQYASAFDGPAAPSSPNIREREREVALIQ